MRGVTFSFTLLAGLLACGQATKTKARSYGKARFADTFSLLSKLNSNPYALNQVFPSSPISLSQGKSAAAAGGGANGLGALLGGAEAATVGSDAAADAVSDSIKDLFNLPEQAPATAAPKKAQQPPAAKRQAPPAPKHQEPPKAAVKAVVEQKAKPIAIAPKAEAAPQVPKAAKVVRPVVAKRAAKPVPKHLAAPAAKLPKKAKPAMVVKKAVPKPAVKVAAKTKADLPTKVAPKPVAAAIVFDGGRRATKTFAKRKAPPAASVARTATTVKVEKAKEAELEAEVSALKAKIAKASQAPAPKAKPVKASPTAAPPRSPVVKSAEAVKPAEVAAAVAPVAMTSVKASHQAKATARRAEDHTFAEDDDSFEGTLASPPSKPLRPLYREEATPAPKETKEVATKATVAVATQTAAPAAEVVSMTMVPEQPSVAAPANIITEGVATGTQPVSFFGTIGNWFHTILFGVAEPLPAPVPTEAPAADPNADRPAFSKQDIEKTQAEAAMDSFSDVAIEDEFVRKESEDEAHIDFVKREDRALRIDAQTPKRPSMPAPANFQHESGSTHISGFWGTLAEEDADIEDALTKDGDDLTEYERLKSLQDAKVQASVGEINGPLGEHLAIERRALRKASSAA